MNRTIAKQREKIRSLLQENTDLRTRNSQLEADLKEVNLEYQNLKDELLHAHIDYASTLCEVHKLSCQYKNAVRQACELKKQYSDEIEKFLKQMRK